MYPQPGQNNGVITVAPTLTDFVAGAETGITEIVRNPSGKWQPSEPPGEWQKLLGVTVPNDTGFNTGGPDFLDCVSFSANDAIETLGDFLLPQWDDEHNAFLKDNGYLNANGTLNFADRFLAEVSGTTKNGNSLPAVWDAFKKHGAVPELAWPTPVDEIKASPANYWDIYYKQIPDSVLTLGEKFLAMFDIAYEWVILPGTNKSLLSVQSALSISPLQIATAVCQGWNNNAPVNGCGAGAQHATLLTGADISGYSILDHYVPFDKQLAPNYDITYAMRGIITPKAAPVKTKISYVFNVNLSVGMDASPEIHKLQETLQYLGYMKPGVFGPFGPQTQSALAAFQKASGIVDAPQGAHFGPQTRAKMNLLTK